MTAVNFPRQIIGNQVSLPASFLSKNRVCYPVEEIIFPLALIHDHIVCGLSMTNKV
jgi:hypothetical protein